MEREELTVETILLLRSEGIGICANCSGQARSAIGHEEARDRLLRRRASLSSRCRRCEATSSRRATAASSALRAAARSETDESESFSSSSSSCRCLLTLRSEW